MSPQLDHIWQQIQALDEADRLALGMRLYELTETQSGERSDANATRPSGWRAVYGTADPTEVAELQRIIDEEFSAVDSEGWD